MESGRSGPSCELRPGLFTLSGYVTRAFNLNTFAKAAAISLIGILSSGAAPGNRIGLKCLGQTRFSVLNSSSYSEEHYVIDRSTGKLIYREPVSGKSLTTYRLTVGTRLYRGIHEEDGRTNGGIPVHHKAEVVISRDDGVINTSSVSTTFFPNGASSQEITFTGKCEREDPDMRSRLKF